MANITHIKDLVPDKKNARRHNVRNISMIVDSLQSVGVSRSIVIDENNEILAGNGTIAAAAKAGITKLQIVDADGETIIAVRRSGLTPSQKTKLALFDNRTAELADWDAQVIADIVASGEDLSDLFTGDEFAALANEVPDVDFKEYTEDVENEVQYCECPECGCSFPK